MADSTQELSTLTEVQEFRRRRESQAAWVRCSRLAHNHSILDRVMETLKKAGVAGEERVIKILYLALTSRLQSNPASVAVKGPSSAGKSYIVDQVLRPFPNSAYYTLSAMSERALAYSEEPLKNLFLVLFEAAGLRGDFASYLVRSLLPEGKVRYETVEKTKNGLRPRLIEREGPSGLLTTTTLVHLHPENETRLLSVPVTDTSEQTTNILLAVAEERSSQIDYGDWHALQLWIADGVRDVTIPFARQLAENIPPVAVRLRRDFGTLLALIKSHAVLHQATRSRDSRGYIVAEIGDYAAVHDLIAELISDRVEAMISEETRETVAAVATFGDKPVSVSQVARKLKLDKLAASRRVQKAINLGYLSNLETTKGRHARLVSGDPVPEDVKVLPEPQTLKDRCTVARAMPDIDTPPPIMDLEEGII